MVQQNKSPPTKAAGTRKQPKWYDGVEGRNLWLIDPFKSKLLDLALATSIAAVGLGVGLLVPRNNPQQEKTALESIMKSNQSGAITTKADQSTDDNIRRIIKEELKAFATKDEIRQMLSSSRPQRRNSVPPILSTGPLRPKVH